MDQWVDNAIFITENKVSLKIDGKFIVVILIWGSAEGLISRVLSFYEEFI